MYKRLQLLKHRGRESCFLWGPRQTGKSTLLKQIFPDSLCYDLLLSDQYARLNARPSLLREEILAQPNPSKPVIIDEVQKIPALLDEVHWLIVNTSRQFILCPEFVTSFFKVLDNQQISPQSFNFVALQLKDQ